MSFFTHCVVNVWCGRNGRTIPFDHFHPPPRLNCYPQPIPCHRMMARVWHKMRILSEQNLGDLGEPLSTNLQVTHPHVSSDQPVVANVQAITDLVKKSAFSGVNQSYLGQLASSLQCDNTFDTQIWNYGYR